MTELKLIEVTWNVNDYAVDFIIPSKYDHIVLEHKEEIVDKLEFLTKSLKEGTYPFGNIRGLGHIPQEKNLLTIKVSATDTELFKELFSLTLWMYRRLHNEHQQFAFEELNKLLGEQFDLSDFKAVGR